MLLSRERMKAVLQYDLPEDETDYKNAVNGWRWRRVVEEMDSRLRDKLKYDTLPDPLYDEIQHVRDGLFELLHDFNLTLDED